jgi:hypothetical protein
VAKKKKPSQLQRLQLPQLQQLPQLMQHLQQLLLPLLLAPLLLLQLQLQQHPHQPESNSLLKRKKPLQSGFFYILLLTYLISCSSNRVSKR